MTKAFVLLELQGQQVLVARQAKARGLRVVVLNHDPLRDSGAFVVAPGLVDELLHVESWSDADAVRRMVDDLDRRYDIVGVHAAFEATLRYAAELRDRVGLPDNNVSDIVRALDKGQVRRKLYAEGLSHLRSTSMAEALAWDRWRFSGPAVLKPCNGTGSVLCFVVSSLDELRAAAGKAEAAAFANPLLRDYVVAHGTFVLEELAPGELLSVESLVYNGTVHHVGLTGRYTLDSDRVVEQGLFFPYHHPRRDEIVAACERFHRSLNIRYGATHLEVMVAAHGPIELIDFNLRFAGLGALVLVNEAFGLRFETHLTDLACGVEPDLDVAGQPTRFAVDLLVMPPPGVTEFRDLTFPPGSIARRLTKKIGQQLIGTSNQIDAVAMFAVTGDTAAEAHAKAIEARRRVVFNGEPIGDHPALRLAFGEYVGKHLDPAPIGPVMPYSGRWLDRASGRRRNVEWVAATRSAPGARVLPLWRDQCLVAGDPPAPLILPVAESAAMLATADDVAFLGLDDNGAIFAADLSSVEQADAIRLTGADRAADIRSLVNGLEVALAANLAYARGLLHWTRHHRFCGACGATTSSSEGGHVRVCDNTECALLLFPKIEPAVIMLVETEGPPRRCLLARHKGSAVGGYSTLAGFVEVGESLEDAVGRELAEEAGVRIRSATYVASQAWPFPAGIMIGFRAVAADDTVTVDDEELVEARWFTRADLLELRASGRRLGRVDSIDGFLLQSWLDEQEPTE